MIPIKIMKIHATYNIAVVSCIACNVKTSEPFSIAGYYSFIGKREYISVDLVWNVCTMRAQAWGED